MHFRSPVELFYDFKQALDDRCSTPDDLGALTEFSEAAISRFVEWFGPPSDADRPYVIRATPETYSSCRYNVFLRRYIIKISHHHTQPARIRLVLAHEMYHRITFRRGLLHQQVWVEEMMAHLAAQRFLKEQGFQEFLSRRLVDLLKKPYEKNQETIRAARRNPVWLGTTGSVYPNGFEIGVIRLGEALRVVAGWPNLCRLVHADTIEDWIDSLSANAQYAVRRLLQMPHPDSPLGNNADAHLKFAVALMQAGNLEAAVQEVEEAVRLRPDHVITRYLQGSILGRAGQEEAALDAYLVAHHLDPTHAATCLSIGTAYLTSEKIRESVHWLQTAVQLRPDDAGFHFNLGAALEKDGQLAEARREWGKTIALEPDSQAAHDAKAGLKRLDSPTDQSSPSLP